MQTTEEPANPPSRRVSRIGLYLPTLLLLALMIGWSGFWIYSSRIAGQALADWRAAEQARGRVWSCENESIGGFPFRIELTCAKVALERAGAQGAQRVSVGGLTALAQIYAPKLILADLVAPLRDETSGATLSWTGMRASIRLADGLERVSLAGRGLAWSAGPAQGEAETAELHLRPDPQRAADDAAVDFALRLDKARLPALDALLASTEKVSAEASGLVTQTALFGRMPGLPQTLEAWRMGGGSLSFNDFRLTNGTTELAGKGQLNLDEQRRPAGQFSVSAKGVGPLLARFGAGGIGQIAGSLLGGRDGAPVQWPLRVQDGRISLGPLRTPPVLAPLY